MKWHLSIQKTATRILRAAIVVFDTLFFRRNLKWEILLHKQACTVLKSELNNVRALFEKRFEALEKDEQSARAQLCRLRVQQETILDRTGFMVSAFIPERVLKQIREGTVPEQDAFRNRVLNALLNHALSGLFRVNKLGNLTAMIFEPLGVESNKRIVTPIFESTKDGKPVFQAVVSPELQLIQHEQKKLLTEAIESVK